MVAASSEGEGDEPLDESGEGELSAVDCESPPLDVGVAEALLPCWPEDVTMSVALGVAEPEAEPVTGGFTMTVVEPSGVTLVETDALWVPDSTPDEGPTS